MKKINVILKNKTTLELTEDGNVEEEYIKRQIEEAD